MHKPGEQGHNIVRQSLANRLLKKGTGSRSVKEISEKSTSRKRACPPLFPQSANAARFPQNHYHATEQTCRPPSLRISTGRRIRFRNHCSFTHLLATLCRAHYIHVVAETLQSLRHQNSCHRATSHANSNGCAPPGLRLYARRIAGGDRHHWHAGRAAAASDAEGGLITGEMNFFDGA